MLRIKRIPLPEHSLLQQYMQMNGCYTDCYTAEVEGHIATSRFIEAFYTTRLFKLERWLLQQFAKLPSTDLQAKQLANAETETFAAWRVEQRNDNQLLMCDVSGRTRSWFMTAQDGESTLLYFGSAVTPMIDSKNGKSELGIAFRLLLGFHKIYSRLLLQAAAGKLRSKPTG